MTYCEFCDFKADPKVWTINIYSCTSYKYEGKKYFLDIEYPIGDMTKYPSINAVEINYCPMCGKKLNTNHKVFRGGQHENDNCIPADNAKYAHWIYWDGWVGNSAQRIDDATCSECGYKHHTVWRKEGDEPNSTPNKLADVCPSCKSIMKKYK